MSKGMGHSKHRKSGYALHSGASRLATERAVNDPPLQKPKPEMYSSVKEAMSKTANKKRR